MAMIEIKNISKWYGNFQVLKDCSVDVEKGEVVVVCGPSGSGKSTLIKTVNALEPFQKGEIIVDGISVGDPKTDLPKLRSRVGMVFQHFELFPHLSIRENLVLAQMKVLGRGREEATERGLKLLDRVGGGVGNGHRMARGMNLRGPQSGDPDAHFSGWRQHSIVTDAGPGVRTNAQTFRELSES